MLHNLFTLVSMTLLSNEDFNRMWRGGLERRERTTIYENNKGNTLQTYFKYDAY